MLEEIKIGDMAKDICGNEGEVIDVEYHEDGTVFRYILMQYDKESGCANAQWPAYPDYTIKLN